MNVLPLALPLTLLLATAVAQDPDDVLARFQLDGKPAVVTRADVALEMAFAMRRKDKGLTTVAQLVDVTLTRRAAERKHLMPTRDEAIAFWSELQQQLRAGGQRPEDFPAIRNSSRERLYDDIAVQLAHQRLVRAELDLKPTDPVSADMLTLWLQEERRRSEVVVDPDQLPIGACARIGDQDLPIADLGFMLLRFAEDAERTQYVKQVVYLQLLDALARREGVQITDADLDAAIEQRRNDVARDPRYRGVPFEQLLKADGQTLESLRQLRTFRAHALLDKLAARHFLDADLQAELARDRQHVLDLIGPRRHLGIIFVRALDLPNALVPLDFPAAEQKLRQARERLAKETFANVASIESEHQSSKMRGGEIGWHHRISGQLPDQVLAIAFALDEGEVSQPVRSEEGVFLVKVLEIEPMPSDHRLIEQLRDQKATELQQKLLRDAAIELVPGNPVAPR